MTEIVLWFVSGTLRFHVILKHTRNRCTSITCIVIPCGRRIYHRLARTAAPLISPRSSPSSHKLNELGFYNIIVKWSVWRHTALMLCRYCSVIVSHIIQRDIHCNIYTHANSHIYIHMQRVVYYYNSVVYYNIIMYIIVIGHTRARGTNNTAVNRKPMTVKIRIRI